MCWKMISTFHWNESRNLKEAVGCTLVGFMKSNHKYNDYNGSSAMGAVILKTRVSKELEFNGIKPQMVKQRQFSPTRAKKT